MTSPKINWLKSNEQNKSKINQMHAKLLQLLCDCSNTTAESQVHYLQTAVDLLNFLEVEILTNTPAQRTRSRPTHVLPCLSGLSRTASEISLRWLSSFCTCAQKKEESLWFQLGLRGSNHASPSPRFQSVGRGRACCTKSGGEGT